MGATKTRAAKYNDYKDSGIEWLGVVPAHWDLKRLRVTIDSIQNGLWGEEANDANDGIICVRVADFDRKTFRVSLLDPTYRSVSEKEKLSRLLSNGDLLLEKSGGGELQPVGAVVLFDLEIPAINSNFIARMRIKRENYDANFLTYLHGSLYSRRINTRAIKQTTGIQNLDQTAYLNERVALPPLVEQRAIADFLDYRTTRIDALIAKKQRLIELLEEKRSTLITQAVTRGLEANTPMKESGVEWLGKIPAHWDTKALKFCVGLNEHTLSESTSPDFRLSYIDIGNVDSHGSLLGLQEMDFSDAPSRARRIVKAGDTILSTVRTYLKAISYFEEPDGNLIASTGFAVLSPTDHLVPEYLWRLVQSKVFVEKVVAHSVGVSYPAINPSTLASLVIWFPPFEEQKEIVDHIDKSSYKIDKLISRVDSAVQKLMEYRSSLISAAVTGQIDVQGWQPPAEAADG